MYQANFGHGIIFCALLYLFIEGRKFASEASGPQKTKSLYLGGNFKLSGCGYTYPEL